MSNRSPVTEGILPSWRSGKRWRATPVVLLILLSLVVVSMGRPAVVAATDITGLSPSSGPAGTTVTVTGTIETNNGPYEILWDSMVIRSGSASGLGVSRSFSVPDGPGGTHGIYLRDATNSTTSVVASFTVTPSISVTPTSGAAGATVTVSGVSFATSETGIAITFDATAVQTGIAASSLGAWSGTFIVPEAASGVAHVIDAYGTTPATNVPDVNFTVTPVITISPDTGAGGTQITVTGKGFANTEATISVYYDGVVVASGVTATATGGWTANFPAPDGAGGIHYVDAGGATTLVDSVANVPFTVAPKIAIAPTSGLAGTVVTVTGSGFAASETGIIITLDSQPMGPPVNADVNGKWAGAFTAPAGAGGSHNVGAYGNATTAPAVTLVPFSIAAKITVNPVSGTVGSKATVTGASFGASESSISISWDGTPLVTGLNADAQGNWSGSITVPPSAAGNHQVLASGSFTLPAGVAPMSFSVLPDVAVAPATGFVGTSVSLTGTGFAASKALTVTYEGADIITAPNPASTSAQGGFTVTFVAPRSKGGAHRIRVTDGTNTRDVDWSMDSTPPPLPALSTPLDGERISMFGNVPVTFQWTSVTDPSGVFYAMQVSVTNDFATNVLQKEGLTNAAYTTTEAETLPLGTYYWRVKAIDGAYNESAWATPLVLRVGWIPLWAFIVIVVLAVLLIAGGVLFWLRSRY